MSYCFVFYANDPYSNSTRFTVEVSVKQLFGLWASLPTLYKFCVYLFICSSERPNTEILETSKLNSKIKFYQIFQKLSLIGISSQKCISANSNFGNCNAFKTLRHSLNHDFLPPLD